MRQDRAGPIQQVAPSARSGEVCQEVRRELGTVAHDLRTPLNVIRLTAEMLQERHAEDEFTITWLGRINHCVDQMTRMIDEILGSVRAEAAPPLRTRPVRAASIVREAVELNEQEAERKAVRIETHLEDRDLFVMADYSGMVRVLSNLLSNAVKHAPADGTVEVDVEPLGESVLFSVRDDGPGIPEADQPHIFERFWRGRNQRGSGLGLGLFIARTIVEAHGGRIRVESRPGHGSRFVVSLPRRLPAVGSPGEGALDSLAPVPTAAGPNSTPEEEIWRRS